MSGAPLLKVSGLRTHFYARKPGQWFGRHEVRAVDNISFEIHAGEVLSLVGESGCGKTTVGRTITRLEKASGGEVLYSGRSILDLSTTQFRPLRKHIQMIFQDPYASLNPRLTIAQTLTEPLRIHGLASNRSSASESIAAMLNKVGLDASMMHRYPHEFSGGQRQRIGIARVMIVQPSLIIADEAVSALDVSIQAQVLNLLKKLQQDSQIAMLFISHDLAVVRHISDRVAVMQQGKIVEQNSKQQIFNNPVHAYTRQLLSSIPRIPRAKTGRV